MRIAHRGARDEAPENTLCAFERALTYPVDGIELDVQLSADNTVIVFHDPTLYRVTGRKTRVAGLTRMQLEKVDWGKWHDPRFAGEPLNTLKETLSRFGPRSRLLIEIKSSPADRKAGRSERLTGEVVRLLSRLSPEVPETHIYILSFDNDVLKSTARLAPQWRLVLNAPERRPAKIMGWPADDLNHLHAVDIRIDRLSRPLAQWIKKKGLQLFTYTCNHPDEVEKALGLEVDALLTDRPGWLSQHMDRD